MRHWIWAAVLVHWNGSGWPFQEARYSLMAFSRARTLSKLPRRMAWLVMSANHRSTRFNQEALVGREVHGESRVRDEPGLHRWVFVGAVVVADEVDLASGKRLGDRIEELDELFVRVARKAAAVNLAARHLERCEQTGSSFAFVVVGHPRGQPWAQGQQGLRAVERLNLGLLVDAEDKSLLRRFHVKADDVGHLRRELGILAELERLDSMGLQSVLSPDPEDSSIGSDPSRRPASRRSSACGLPAHASSWPPQPARPQASGALDGPTSGETEALPILPPCSVGATCRRSASWFPGELAVVRTGFPLRRCQHDPCSESHRLGQGRRSKPPFEHRPIFSRQHQLLGHESHRTWDPRR